MVFDQKERVADFVATVPPFTPSRGWGEYAAIGYLWDGVMIAGTIYNNWSPEAGVIELSSASVDRRWLTRKSIHMMFEFPFNQLKCQLVALRVSEHNSRMRSIAQRFGFDEYLIPRLRGPNEAEAIYTLTKEQWQGEEPTE